MKSKLPATWPGRKDIFVCHPGVDGHFYTLRFREERCKLIWKNLHWLQIREGGKRWSGGSSRIDAQLVRKKYLLLLFGCEKQSWKFIHRQDVVVSGRHYSWFRAPPYFQECEQSIVSCLIAINWLNTLVSFIPCCDVM